MTRNREANLKKYFRDIPIPCNEIFFESIYAELNSHIQTCEPVKGQRNKWREKGVGVSRALY